MKPRHIFIIVLSVIIIATIIGYKALSAPKTPQSTGSTGGGGQTLQTGSGEELNKQGTRRPAQYLHICNTSDGVQYVSQGTPKCLAGDTFQSDYDPSVAGTVFSSPCKTTSGTLRYVYISNDEACPSGTTLLFYNTLGATNSVQTQGTSTNSTLN